MTINLPPVLLATFDSEMVLFFWSELRDHAELLDVCVKTKPGSRAVVDTSLGADLAMRMERALRAMIAGEILGVQLRYRHGKDVFRDTLLQRGESFSVVRINEADVGRAVGP
ncbi:MAG: hypothetical protein U0271_00365 [Polyangiaceae bacterium]